MTVFIWKAIAAEENTRRRLPSRIEKVDHYSPRENCPSLQVKKYKHKIEQSQRCMKKSRKPKQLNLARQLRNNAHRSAEKKFWQHNKLRRRWEKKEQNKPRENSPTGNTLRTRAKFSICFKKITTLELFVTTLERKIIFLEKAPNHKKIKLEKSSYSISNLHVNYCSSGGKLFATSFLYFLFGTIRGRLGRRNRSDHLL